MSKRNPTKKAQKTPLDSKNEKLISVFEAMEDRVSIISKQHVIQYANAALEKDLGPATGRKCYEYFRNRKTACPECKDKGVWAGKTVHDEWYSPKNKKTYEYTDTPLTNPDGTISMLNILHDITERKRTEQALRESEQRYRTLVENQGEGIGITDSKENVFFANPAADVIYRVPPGGLVGKNLREFFDDEGFDFILKQTEIRRAGKKSIYEVEFNCADGEKRIMSVTAAPRFDDKGQFNGTFTIFRDITEHKQAVQALRESEQRYRTLVENQGEGIGITDTKENFIFANPAAEAIYGVPPGGLVGKNLREFFDDEGFAFILEQTEIRRTGKKSTYEVEFSRADGDKRSLLVTATPRFDNDGQFTGTFGIFRDITERKQAEEALKERNRLNELLLNSLPHPAMLIRKDRTVLAANRIALEVGAKVGGFCWRDFGQSDFIPESDKEYINKNKKASLGGTRCYFCLADEALKNQEPANNPELKAWNKVWDAHWVPLSKQLYLHYAIDITDQKKAQEELLFKTTLLEAQSETSIDGILVVDEEGKSILFNKRFGQMWNMPQQLLDTKDDEKMRQYVLNQLKNPDKFLEKVKYLYKHKDQTSRDEIEFKDGKVFDRYSSALIDSNGTYHGRIWYFRDVTHRKRAEEALRWLLHRNELILQTSADGFCVVDLEGKLLEVNPALCAMTGYPKEELVGMELKELEATETAEQIAEHIKTIIKQGYKRFERKHRRKDGKIIDVEVSTQFCELGEDKFFFSFWRDITEHKQLANELKQYKEKIFKTQRHAYIDSMGAIVAHQLNQPLTVINMLLGEAMEDLSKEPSVPETVPLI